MRKLTALFLAFSLIFSLAVMAGAEDFEEIYLDTPGSYTAADGQRFVWTAPENGTYTFSIESPDNWSYWGYAGGYGMVHGTYGEPPFDTACFTLTLDAYATVSITFSCPEYDPNGENTIDFSFTFEPDGTGDGGYVFESTHHVSGDGSYDDPYVYNTIEDLLADWTNRRISEGGQYFLSAPLGGKALTVNSRYTQDFEEAMPYNDWQVGIRYANPDGDVTTEFYSIFDIWKDEPTTTFTFNAAAYEQFSAPPSWMKDYAPMDEPWQDGDMITIGCFGPASSPYFIVLDMIVESPAGEIAGGTCGDDASWSLAANGTLTISGTGAMHNFARPWADYVDSITSIVIEDGITAIGDNAFADCSRVAGVSLPDSATYIGKNAFRYCEALTEITLPEGLITIGSAAFECCARLRTVFVPATVTTIGDNAFHSCERLEEIRVASENANYSSDEAGVLFNKDKTVLLTAPGAIVSYVIPDTVTTIDSYAFGTCFRLSEVTIPDSVTDIGSWAFSYCDLTELVIPGSVTQIANGAFRYSSLTSVTFRDGVTGIGMGAFEYCEDLKTIIFEGSAPEVENDIFLGVNATAYYPENDPSWTKDVMNAISENAYIIWNPTHIHEYSAVVTDPTCTEQGYTTHTCSNCGDSYVDSYVDALGHQYEDGICTVCGIAEPEYLLGDVNGDEVIDTTDAYLIVLYYNERMELDEAQLAAADVNNDGTVDTTDAYYIVLFYNERIDAFPTAN